MNKPCALCGQFKNDVEYKRVQNGIEGVLCFSCAIAFDAAKCPDKLEPKMLPEAERPPEAVNVIEHPTHYTQGGIECIDAIEAALTPEEFRGHCKACAIKYAWREKYKGGDESLEKAVWYLQRALKASRRGK